MMRAPRQGQRVQAWYGARVAMPHHGAVGRVVVSGRGRPRNHLIEIEGRLVVVPAGNLRPTKEVDGE